jgi:signal transduction histidine kinase
LRITQKLGILVAVPLCAVSGFGALALVTSSSGAMKADRLWNLMDTADSAGALVAQLQDERTTVTAYLTAPAGSASVTALDHQTTRTDAAISAYRDLAGRLTSVPQSTRELLQRIDSQLAALPVLRAQIRSGGAPALSAVVFQYRIAIADLLTFQGGVAQAGGAPPDIADTIRAASALAQASESTSEEEVEVLRLAIGTPLTPNAQQGITVARTGYTSGLETFAATVAPDWRSRPEQALAGRSVAEAARLEDLVARTPVGGRVQIDPQAWITAMSAREDALDGVRMDLDREILGSIAAERDHQRVLAGIEAASVAGTVLVALLVSLRLGRPMIRGLRQLREAANAVAYEHLPAAVEELRAGGALTDKTPEEFADRIGPALDVSGSDEIAAVGRAFNAVHREAIRTAADMELLRAGVGGAFIALARRGERLTGALTSELDKAERNEQDPDRLARLFVLDHLAARMSRNNESLLVLGGEGTARVREQAVPLLDIVRGAMGRIERYSRVDTSAVNSSILIVPGVVDHLVHLCAELMDNATGFSSPDSQVTVDASLLADRIILQIADRGIGLTPKQRDELNARLAAPQNADLTTVRAMGLTVSARLASWYGIGVELRPRPGGGTIAEITLPPTLYWFGELSQTPAAGIPAAQPAVAVAAAPPVAAALPAPPAPVAMAAPAGPQPHYQSPVVPADTTYPSPYQHLAAQVQTPDQAWSELSPAVRLPQRRTVGSGFAERPATPTPPASPTPPPAWPSAAPPTTADFATAPEPPPSPWLSAGGPSRPQPPVPAETTLHGLPKRVPLARLPLEALEEQDTPDAEDQRDSSQVSSVLAAYARGIGGHNPDTATSATPRPPTTTSGNF